MTDIVQGSEPETNLGVSSVSIEPKIFLKILLYGKCSIYILLLKFPILKIFLEVLCLLQLVLSGSLAKPLIVGITNKISLQMLYASESH